MPDEGIIDSLSDALDAAVAELGEGTPDVSDTIDLSEDEITPIVKADAAPADEQAVTPSSDEDEQPENGDDEITSLLNEVAAESSDEAPTLTDETVITVTTPEGVESVTIADLKSGYLRQADYTRKTQALAAERKLVEEAVAFHKAFTDNPQEAATYLAQRAGVLEGDARPVEGITIYTEADLEAKVKERLDAAIAEDPRIKDAAQRDAIARVEQAFTNIEKQYDIALSDENKRQILTEAQTRQVADLELVFVGMLERARQARRAKADVSAASPAKPISPAPSDEAEEPKVESVQDALELALAEMSGGGSF